MSGKRFKEKENKRKESTINKKGKKKMNIFWKIVIVLVVILLAILLAGYLYINGKLGEMKIEKIDTENIGINKQTEQDLKGYRNIAILGIDSRADDYGMGNRSDCIIIASINQETKDVKLVSVYRDTYMQIEGHGLDKVTHAYSYGTASLALKTLNTNLDLNIKEYVTVNFEAVVSAVDALNGITLDITDEETKYINGYIDENNKVTHRNSSHITKGGTYKLDGVQALAYSRIRYTAGGAYKRTERMRTVIDAMAKKAKTLNVGELNNFADKILPKVSTNITKGSIISMLPSIASYNIKESIGWPYDTKGITLDRYYGIPVTLESNVLKLHQEIFNDTNYTVPDSVKTISNKIVNKTGYTK